MINGVPRILIIRLSAIGDVVRVLPALHALRNRFPNAQIDWAIEPKSLEAISGNPALDRALVFDRVRGKQASTGNLLRFCREIRQARYDIVIDFHGIFKSGLITRASGAPKRYGFTRPRAQELSSFTTNERVPLLSQRMNRIEENLELCKALGAKSGNLEVAIHIPEDVQDDVDEYLHQILDSGKKLITIHAPVDRPEKQWPLEYYAELCDLLLSDGRYEVLLTWGPGQLEVAEEVRQMTRRKPYVAPETPGLKHYAWMVQRSHLYFGGDTGPMHIASAMGVPVVAVFGGTDPAKHAPLRQPSEVLYAGPETPPRRFSLAAAQAALRAITPETAYEACVRLAR